MKTTRFSLCLALGVLALLLLSACAVDDIVDTSELASIETFTADPQSGEAALAVTFDWTVSDTFHAGNSCGLYIIPPGTYRPRPAHLGPCVGGSFTQTFTEPGLYEAVVFVYTGRSDTQAQSIFDAHAAAFDAENEDDRSVIEWLENRAVQRSLTFEVLKPEIPEEPADQEADTAEPGTAGTDTSGEGEPFWELVFANQNPDGIPTQADILTENAAYAGSKKECKITGNSIVYTHIVVYNGENLANVRFTYEYSEPPNRAQPGETLLFHHLLWVDGDVTVGGGQYPGGRAGLSSDIASPQGLSVASGNLNIEDAPTLDENEFSLRFPPADRDEFTIVASVYDSQRPDIFCDVIYRYELRSSE